jgi:hypothetical protein
MRIKHYTFFICAAFFLFSCGNKEADNSKLASTVKEQANKMGQFLVTKDYKSFAKMTYPKLVEMMGGEDRMIDAMKGGSQETGGASVEILSVTIGDVSKIIKAGAELQCTVKEVIETKVESGKLVAESMLIAISQDEGKHWYFIDASNKDIITLRQSLPNLSDSLKITPMKEPIFWPDN